MLRRNPDLAATVAVALYLFIGHAKPAIPWHDGYPHRAELREEIRRIVKAEVRSILRELALSIQQ